MIDWYGVGANALWIIGVAGLLAILSFSYWTGQVHAVAWRQVISTAGSRASLSAALFVLACGLALSVGVIWQAVGWGLVSVVALYQGILAWMEYRRAGNGE